ncbi:MAG: FAD binding domain-containing protein [Alphaproteobacteria bacterium]|nr:FAD binding domain-containing protein [Alphaproteobacteria bacterium]
MGYVRPTSLTDALTCLAGNDMRVAAGCTDLFPATGHQHLAGNILDITALSALRGITNDSDHLRIGATTTWSDIVQADLPQGFHQLQQAAREVGSIQIQNAATIGGNLCNASPAADGVPPLLALDALVELSSLTGTRTLPLAQFITGPRETGLASGELLTALLIPQQSTRGRSVFLKLGARRYLVISIAMIAARLVETDGQISDAAIAVGSCSAVATRLKAVENELIGQVPSPDLVHRISDGSIRQHLAPITDTRADAPYRNIAAAELVRRALGQLLADHQQEAA